MKTPEKIYINPEVHNFISSTPFTNSNEYTRSDIAKAEAEKMAKEFALSLLKSISEQFDGVYCEHHGEILDGEISELEEILNSRKA